MPRGFTLVELLVTITIIAIIASLLLPVLSRAKERTRRTACSSNMRQVILAAQLYAHDCDDFLPRADSHCTALINKKTMTNFVRYSGMTDVLDCPNLHGKFIRRSSGYPQGWREQGPNIAIGYHYLGGQKATPWLDSAELAVLRWSSPQKFSEPPTTLVADLNTCYDGMTVVPHTRRGATVLDTDYFKNRPNSGLVYPTNRGAEGGNVGSMDGSVVWRDVRKISARIAAHEWGGPLIGWW